MRFRDVPALPVEMAPGLLAELGEKGEGPPELIAPDLVAARPAHDGLLVRRPLGRHPEAVGRGGAQRRAFRVRLRSSCPSSVPVAPCATMREK